MFVNKTDRAGFDAGESLRDLKRRLSADCVDMGGFCGGEMPEAVAEAVAERDEALLDRLLEGDYDAEAWLSALRGQLRRRELFPVYFGSALNDAGVSEFLDALCLLTGDTAPDDQPFDALVYKVRRDAQGGRLTFFRVLSGSVGGREEVRLPSGETAKINELRLYSGAKFRQVPRAERGMLCAAAGLPPGDPGGAYRARAGRSGAASPRADAGGLGAVGPSVPAGKVLQALRQLEEEDPALNVSFVESTGGIDVNVMGPIQLEVLKQLMQDRFGIPVEFGRLRVMYMETIAAPAIGIGHYEPLRHYAEVQLRLSPGPRGSGITFESRCHVDELALNWQRLIETHVFEKAHKGVLTGARLTDVKVELLHGRAHLKHTEGGDFRQSTYRAIRNALMYAQSVLLEPVCRFEPAGTRGRLRPGDGRPDPHAGQPGPAGDGRRQLRPEWRGPLRPVLRLHLRLHGRHPRPRRACATGWTTTPPAATPTPSSPRPTTIPSPTTPPIPCSAPTARATTCPGTRSASTPTPRWRRNSVKLECVSKCITYKIMQEEYGCKPDGRKRGSGKRAYRSEWRPFGTP